MQAGMLWHCYFLPGCIAADLPLIGLDYAQAGVPERLWKCYLALVVVPPSTPLPATMLALLWSLEGPAEAEATANDLAQHGVLRVAHLEDGSTWTLPQPEHMTMLQVQPLLAPQTCQAHMQSPSHEHTLPCSLYSNCPKLSVCRVLKAASADLTRGQRPSTNAPGSAGARCRRHA